MWVVTIERQPMRPSSSRIARPSAAPSVGSVPAPSSSSSTSDCEVALARISLIRRTCDENVESDCSRLCSSPMSASTSSKIGNCEPSPAGTCRPDWAMIASRPTVFERHRLAAGVRPGHDQDVETGPRDSGRSARPFARARASQRAVAGSGSGGTAGRRLRASGDDSAGDRHRLAGRDRRGGAGFARAGSPRKKASSNGCRAARRTSRPS